MLAIWGNWSDKTHATHAIDNACIQWACEKIPVHYIWLRLHRKFWGRHYKFHQYWTWDRTSGKRNSKQRRALHPGGVPIQFGVIVEENNHWYNLEIIAAMLTWSNVNHSHSHRQQTELQRRHSQWNVPSERQMPTSCSFLKSDGLTIVQGECIHKWFRLKEVKLF